MSKSILKDKSYDFAIMVVKLSQFLVSKKKEFVLSKQLLRSGTAVGALIREAEFAQSKKDFVNKMSISLKEANETMYWLDLLKDTNYINEEEHQNHLALNKELVAMLVSSIKTTKSNIQKMKQFKYLLRAVTFSFSLFSFHFVNAQQLETLIDEALTNSPEIQKFELQYSIATEKVNEVNTLPNTEFGVGYFVSEPETRTGAQRFKVTAKQMLPWFGNITARENYVSALADAKYEDIVIAKRKLMASVSQSYYNIHANKAKQDVLSENIKLLETYETLALTSVEVGKASAVDVLRLQMRQNEMQQLLDVLSQQYLAEQTNFNKLLNRDKDIAINVLSELNMPSEDFETNTNNLALHPELLKYDKLYQSIEQSELLNQKESSPMIGFGLDYINVDKRPDMNFNDNGKDIVMPMVSLSIPIFNNKYKSQTKQNELQQQEIVVQKQERSNTLETLLDKAINDRISARISYKTQAKNLKQAKDAEEILIKSYETGTIDFNDVLDIQELQLKFQMNQIESVKAYYVQTTIINYLTN